MQDKEFVQDKQTTFGAFVKATFWVAAAHLVVLSLLAMMLL